MTIPALTSATTSDQSFTKKYETHKIKKEGRGKSKTYYPFVFNDIMGLEKGDGVRVDDIILALKGHVKDGYKFNPVSPLSDEDPGYNPRPSPEDKVHVLVWVLSANATKITESVLKKMKEIREAASDLGIPQMAIVTHIDAACPETEKDLKNVYKSQYLKKKVYDISASVGIPVNCIFPVKNYSDDIDIDDDVNTLILSALRKIIDFGDDFIDCGSTLHYSTICRSYRMGGFLRFPAKPSSSSSSSWTTATVKVFLVVTGWTFGADYDILEQVKRSPEVETTRNPQECDLIIVFCSITSRVGSDVEAAMREDSVSSGGKPVILVLMHHTRDPDYSTDVRRWSETFQNVVLDVHVLFHETQPGLLALFKK
ncbi:hypothetical protein PFLUV_G00150510 [Perca fluviatilis]|uniref:Uncharacterized protein n=1 Tax=Perca fluviatilis TaxID=8168 RepID=A0A6A5E3Q0_PERFL|nr:hypothetical protein PFLUV_G00150510 [Perca fluviatilis]